MRARLRTKSGRPIAPHGKKDSRMTTLKRGTRLEADTRVCYRKGLQYTTASVLTVVSNQRGIRQKNSRWITKGSVVAVPTESTPLHVKILSRTGDHLVGKPVLE